MSTPSTTPSERADQADERALHDEDPQDAARRRADGAQDRDVGLLLLARPSPASTRC